ncbi:hypothetical protein A2930_00380 [Candidatus Giovannonibacteria bacterium RIFCSPLOWO2_01_FULL_45_34]|uniref:Homing endonuclease LAGLIDADG domain-containing protein n=1 Tax=Candidatus Giovannonibacteria bacterium RIFCSPLOWO2_01_FULL_45_34 TaxID=1798351 RepID=A0A1F5X0V3_9BACT|nr:MAG: hypothetical protein A2930_00380 [Candidatus Giovannonibacteria bacterium RIFCSPLOWO2_01_FULL_45_34]
MLQIKKRSDSKKGWRFMSTICFYQDSRHDKPLSWIKKILGIGYLSKRNDGMTELRINGYRQIHDILKILLPFIQFKRVQAEALLKASALLAKKSLVGFSLEERQKLLNWILIIQSNNYASRTKTTKEILEKVLDLTP